MKLLLYPLAFLLLSIPIQQDEDNIDFEKTLKGTWELDSFYYYDNNEISDTIPTTEGYRQIKIFTDDRVMWTRFVPMDSVEWFGYGHYMAIDSQLIETLEYGSASMMKIIDTMRVFTFELTLDDDRYSQITLDEEGNRFSAENYKRIE
tara:strand:- start:4 stop:447 length:444 start_codon:yes stop_codon:yes gene_type:complete